MYVSGIDVGRRWTATFDTDVTARRQRALSNTCAASVAVVQSRRDAERATLYHTYIQYLFLFYVKQCLFFFLFRFLNLRMNYAYMIYVQ